MGVVARFILALAVAGIAVSGGSLVWPRLTRAPRPEALQKVHDVVIKTPQGEEAAQLLGVTDEKDVAPINPQEVATTALHTISTAIEKRAQTIIMSQVAIQLAGQYEKLPQDQQKQLREIICHSSPSGVVE